MSRWIHIDFSELEKRVTGQFAIDLEAMPGPTIFFRGHRAGKAEMYRQHYQGNKVVTLDKTEYSRDVPQKEEEQ